MQPDLSPHLHTEECNFLIGLLKDCMKENKFTRFLGVCNYWDEAVWQCTKAERILRRNTNPHYKQRLVEHRRLPYEFYTPVLNKLKEEGILNLDSGGEGCRI